LGRIGRRGRVAFRRIPGSRIGRTPPVRPAIVGEGAAEEGRSIEMQDLLYLLIAIAFFAVAAAYVRGCDRL